MSRFTSPTIGVLLAVVLAALAGCGQRRAEAPCTGPDCQQPVRPDASAPAAPTDEVEARAEELLAQLTLDEKLSLVAGTGFDTAGVPRLGIPRLSMTDGPVGVRSGKSTAFPAGVLMAATFDPPLIQRLGAALGRETKAHGKNVLLAPCVNIHRVPHGGRNF